MSDFATPAIPTEVARRIELGRVNLMKQLETSTTRNALRNTVQYTGAMVDSRARAYYDNFTVTTSSGDATVSEADKRRFEQLGCTVVGSDKRIAILQFPHTRYDRRLVAIDMSTPQCCTVGFLGVVALCLLGGALWI